MPRHSSCSPKLTVPARDSLIERVRRDSAFVNSVIAEIETLLSAGEADVAEILLGELSIGAPLTRLTLTTAAKLLEISRANLVDLIKGHHIESHAAGCRHSIRLVELVRFQGDTARRPRPRG